MVTALPGDVKYGYVADRMLRVVLDTPNDEDALPDGIAAVGTVTFLPVRTLFTAEDGRTGVVGSPFEFKIHQGEGETTPNAPKDSASKGLLVNPNTGHTGSHALVTGWYNVAYKVAGYQTQYGPFHITEQHTADNPFWVRENIELVPTPEVRFVINEAILNEVRQIRDDLLDSGATPEQIEQAVSDYLAENPPQVDGGVETVNGKSPDEDGNVVVGDEDIEVTYGQDQRTLAYFVGDIETLVLSALEEVDKIPDLLIGYAKVEDLPDLSGYVAEGDPRLSDAREPLSHSHPEHLTWEDLPNLDGYVTEDDPRLTDARHPLAHGHPEYLTEEDLPEAPDLSGFVRDDDPRLESQWVRLTQAEYDAIETPDPDTLYIVVG